MGGRIARRGASAAAAVPRRRADGHGAPRRRRRASDEAIAVFDRFLSGLPAGAQLFALFEANPHLLDLVTEICAAAPRLGAYLGRHSGVLDAVLDRAFFDPLPDAETLAADLRGRLAEAADYEAGARRDPALGQGAGLSGRGADAARRRPRA
jgi:hypothetical protein